MTQSDHDSDKGLSASLTILFDGRDDAEIALAIVRSLDNQKLSRVADTLYKVAVHNGINKATQRSFKPAFYK